MSEDGMIKKLIRLPREINDVLLENKRMSGMSATAYIQEAVYRKMIHDKLIKIKRTTVEV